MVLHHVDLGKMQKRRMGEQLTTAQKRWAKQLGGHGSGILCSDGHNGKSLAVLASVVTLECFPLVIICHQYKKISWKNEIAKVEKNGQIISLVGYDEIDSSRAVINDAAGAIFDDLDKIGADLIKPVDYDSDDQTFNQEFVFSDLFSNKKNLFVIVSKLCMESPKDILGLWRFLSLINSTVIGCDRKRVGARWAECTYIDSFKNPSIEPINSDLQKKLLMKLSNIIAGDPAPNINNYHIVNADCSLLDRVKKGHTLILSPNGTNFFKSLVGNVVPHVKINDLDQLKATKQDTVFVYEGHQTHLLPNGLFRNIVILDYNVYWPRCDHGGVEWYICTKDVRKPLEQVMVAEAICKDNLQDCLDFIDNYMVSRSFDGSFFWFAASHFLANNYDKERLYQSWCVFLNNF